MLDWLWDQWLTFMLQTDGDGKLFLIFQGLVLIHFSGKLLEWHFEQKDERFADHMRQNMYLAVTGAERANMKYFNTEWTKRSIKAAEVMLKTERSWMHDL